MTKLKVYVYQYDRSEEGLAFPIIQTFQEFSMYVDSPRHATDIIIPSDRREAIRFALDMFEGGKRIHHVGAGDECRGDWYHYDGIYRKFITQLAQRSGGRGFALHYDVEPQLDVIGPPQIENMPDTSKRPKASPYKLLCHNPMAFPGQMNEVPEIQGDVYAANVGNDGDGDDLTRRIGDLGYEMLPRMERNEFLPWLRNADEVWGNSSCLCYEAPIWHPDENIHLYGLRNQGRKIVRWNTEKYGTPSVNLARILRMFYDGLEVLGSVPASNT